MFHFAKRFGFRLACGFERIKIQGHFQNPGLHRNGVALLRVSRHAVPIVIFILKLNDLGHPLHARNLGDQVVRHERMLIKELGLLARQYLSWDTFLRIDSGRMTQPI